MRVMGRSSPRLRRGLLAVGALSLFVSACGTVAPTVAPVRLPDATIAATAPPTATPSTSAPTETSPPVAGAATRAEVARLQAAVDADPSDPDAQRALAEALTQLIRETLDPSLYEPAEAALREADRLQPDDARTLADLGTLQLGRHQFADALETGRRAIRLSPGLAAAHGVVVDALVELGRYEEADTAAQAMFAAGDDLGALARLSYLRELHGDLAGARDLMARAVDTPGAAPEHLAFALSVLGNLQRWTGDPDAARASWMRALELVPDHPPSLAGLGRLALGEGDLAGAATWFGRAADVVPLPEYVIASGEIDDAAGDGDAARDQFALARAEIDLFQANGVTVDLELALFEADHGSPARALELARAAWSATPTVRAADAVGWALHRIGRDREAARWTTRAVALGSREPLLRFHAGAIAAVLGHRDAARRDLQAALDTDPGFSAAGAAEARRLLATLQD